MLLENRNTIKKKKPKLSWYGWQHPPSLIAIIKLLFIIGHQSNSFSISYS